MGKIRKGWRAWAIVIVGRYVIAQGMHNMNNVERAHRLTIETIVFLMLRFLLFNQILEPYASLAAFCSAHLFNIILNGHLFALFKHDLYWFGFYNKWDDFSAYVENMQQRFSLRPCKGLASAEIFGSISRGKFSPNSDLDIRLIAKPGWLNAWVTCNRVLEERVRALFTGFPLDIYMFRNQEETAKKMNLMTEKPILIYSSGNPSGCLPFHQQASFSEP